MNKKFIDSKFSLTAFFLVVFIVISSPVWSQENANNSVFGEQNVLRIDDDLNYFLKASVEISRNDFSRMEYETVAPDFRIDDIDFIPATKLAEIAHANITFNDDGSVTIVNNYNHITVNEEGKKTSDSGIITKKMKLAKRENVFYVPARLANDLGLTIKTNEDTQTLTISKPFVSQILIVITDNINLDTYGAVKSLMSTKFHCVLYYETIEKVQEAYEQLSKHSDVKAVDFNDFFVFVDDSEHVILNKETNRSDVLIDGVWSQNMEAMDAIEFATGGANLDLIANAYGGYRNDDIVGVWDTGFEVNAEYANKPLTEIINPFDITDLDTNIWSPANSHHGTHVLGTVAQFSKGCKIMPIKVFNDAGVCTIMNSMDAFNYILNYNQELNAEGKKMVAINLSYGGIGYSEVVQLKINELYDAGIIVVPGAGNDNLNARIFRFANLGHVTAVGSFSHWEGSSNNYPKSGFSNFGECVTIYAPGEAIYSEIGIVDGVTQRGLKWGTSMAAPVATGIIMLMHRALYNASQNCPQIFEVSPKSINAFLRAGDNHSIQWIGEESQYSPPYSGLIHYLNL